jgi:NifB/MoaA-like Fe-S oxidoreductase
MRVTTDAITELTGIRTQTVGVDNTFLGTSVTVAGLLSGEDVRQQLAGMPVGDVVVVPKRALDQKRERFLDGTTVESLAGALGAPVRCGGEFADLLRALELRR